MKHRSLPELRHQNTINKSKPRVISENPQKSANNLLNEIDWGSEEVAVTDVSEMLTIVRSIMAPLIRQWVNNHRHIDVKVLVTYLTSAVMEFGIGFVSKPVITPTWQAIHKA
jgi:hypothetical protein